MAVTLLRYSPTRLHAAIALFVVTAALALLRIYLLSLAGSYVPIRSMWWQLRVDVFLPAVLVVAALVVWRLLALLKSDGAALKSTDAGLEVTTLFRRKLLPWNSLLGSQNLVYWTGPHRRQRLTIRYLEDGSTKSLRIPTMLTERPQGGHATLPETIDRAQASALGRDGTLGGVDPDAAIARYLAAKKATAAEIVADKPAPAAARPVFGRKGLDRSPS